MRNGPCGGTFNGQCEVIPEQACIWVEVYERAKAADRVDELKTYIPPRNRALQGTSSYINYFLDRDSRPDHPAAVDHDRECDSRCDLTRRKHSLVKRVKLGTMNDIIITK